MKAIVFSRERPMQLDLLLTSLERNAPGMFEPTVIWFSRKDEFQAGYAICEKEHPEATFMIEDGLTYQVRSLVRSGERLCFFTDDDVLYRPLRNVPMEADWICFSLRLGLNTARCYPLDCEQRIPDHRANGDVISWNWQRGDGDFGYPMSLDGHVFRAKDLKLLLAVRHFGTPNLLEAMLVREARKIPRRLLASFRESHLVGIPANRVNIDTPNRNGETHPYTVQELNERYLRGERIDLDALDFSDIRGAHQEMELIFR